MTAGLTMRRLGASCACLLGPELCDSWLRLPAVCLQACQTASPASRCAATSEEPARAPACRQRKAFGRLQPRLLKAAQSIAGTRLQQMLPSQRALGAAAKVQAWPGLRLCCPHPAQRGYSRQAEGLWAAARQGTSCRRPAAVSCQACHRNWRSMLYRGRRACLCQARQCSRGEQATSHSPGLCRHPTDACRLQSAPVSLCGHGCALCTRAWCSCLAATYLPGDRGGTSLLHFPRDMTARHARHGVLVPVSPCAVQERVGTRPDRLQKLPAGLHQQGCTSICTRPQDMLATAQHSTERLAGRTGQHA